VGKREGGREGGTYRPELEGMLASEGEDDGGEVRSTALSLDETTEAEAFLFVRGEGP